MINFRGTIKLILLILGICVLPICVGATSLDPLPLQRGKATCKIKKAVKKFMHAVQTENKDLHSLMIVQNGKIVAEKWFSGHTPETPHIMNSVSKTFTAMAVGFAVDERKLKTTDKILSFFPEFASFPDIDKFEHITVEHLLTMTIGVRADIRLGDTSLFNKNVNWVENFFSSPMQHEPGAKHVYNSMSTYILSAIVQKVTGKKLLDYLEEKLFRHLGIVGATWEESPQGIHVGGWGLFIKTEDMAKLGQFLLQKGNWNGIQLLSSSWIERASSKLVETHYNPKVRPDWAMGYGYQLWRCSKYGAYRADGANGQFVIVVPRFNAVIVLTSHVSDMQKELDLVWKHLLPALAEYDSER